MFAKAQFGIEDELVDGVGRGQQRRFEGVLESAVAKQIQSAIDDHLGRIALAARLRRPALAQLQRSRIEPLGQGERCCEVLIAVGLDRLEIRIGTHFVAYAALHRRQ